MLTPGDPFKPGDEVLTTEWVLYTPELTEWTAARRPILQEVMAVIRCIRLNLEIPTDDPAQMELLLRMIRDTVQ